MDHKKFFLPGGLQPVLLIVLLGWVGFVATVAAQSVSPTGFKTIVLDAGHGGKDPGAIGKIVKEKDVVLSITLKVGEYLAKEMPGVNVVYTRATDVFVPLDERAEIANRAKADLFVSIHANAISNPKIVGAETFVLGLHRSEDNLEVAKKENSVIVLEEDYNTKYEGFDPNSTESYIIFELMQNVFLDQSIEVASLVQTQFETRAGRNNRGVKQAGFLVLRKTAMPAILVEVGFLSNRMEEIFMSTEEGRDFLASAIFRAIRDYKTHFEARNGVKKPVVIDNPAASTDTTQELALGAINNGDQIEFRVQVASSGTRISEKAGPFAHFKEVWMYQEGGLYKYTTGLSSSYEEISQVLKEARKKVPDCFVVAFKNGKKVPVSSVR